MAFGTSRSGVFVRRATWRRVFFLGCRYSGGRGVVIFVFDFGLVTSFGVFYRECFRVFRGL